MLENNKQWKLEGNAIISYY